MASQAAGRERARAVALLVALGVVVVLAAVVVTQAGRSNPDADGDGTGAGRPNGTAPVTTTIGANATVVRVIDGDTLVADIDGDQEHVRFIGIDTPESVALDRPDECYGKEASERTKGLLPPGTPIRLERDVEPRDQYDRLLAYVYRATDGLFVNESLVADGYAAAKEFPPNTTLHTQLDAAQGQAQTGRKGLWSACGSPDVTLAPSDQH
jgi:micrococcal nuclease